MVLEEGLDISRLPKTLKDDFNQLDKLEGQYRVTSIHLHMVIDLVIDLEDSKSSNGPRCGFCNVKEEAEKMKMIVEHYKPMTKFSKVEVGFIVMMITNMVMIIIMIIILRWGRRCTRRGSDGLKAWRPLAGQMSHTW